MSRERKDTKKKETELRIIDIRKIRFAPEVEVEFPKGVDADKIISHEKIRGWEVKYDGTLENGAEFIPLDSNKLYWNAEGLRQLRDVIRRVKSHKGRISERCGLHIHIDMSTLTDAEVARIFREFIIRQRWIVKKFHVRQDRLDAYCSLLPRKWSKKITETNVNTYRKNGQWYSGYDYFDRHSALNILCLPQNGSIEFRLFNGSRDYEQLKHVIHWCLLFIKDCVEREDIRGGLSDSCEM